MQRCGLAEAGITADAHLEGAAAGTFLSLPYCQFLVLAVVQATASTADQTADQSRRNNSCSVHNFLLRGGTVHSLRADIANSWRLAGYLIEDDTCFRCRNDVFVQREVPGAKSDRDVTAMAGDASTNAQQPLKITLSSVLFG